MLLHLSLEEVQGSLLPGEGREGVRQLEEEERKGADLPLLLSESVSVKLQVISSDYQ